MTRALVLLALLGLALPAAAQLYKWVDKDGKVTYSDQPPPAGQSKQINVGGGAPAPAAAPAAGRSAVDKDKDLNKNRAEAQAKAKVAAAAQERAKAEEAECVRAKAYLRTVTDGGRIATYDAKGERVLLDDKQIEEERVKARKAVDDTCKGS